MYCAGRPSLLQPKMPQGKVELLGGGPDRIYLDDLNFWVVLILLVIQYH